ncbi:MAG: hypothetical protein AAB896_03140 [Patescibacteria group bacterium]
MGERLRTSEITGDLHRDAELLLGKVALPGKEEVIGLYDPWQTSQDYSDTLEGSVRTGKTVLTGDLHRDTEALYPGVKLPTHEQARDYVEGGAWETNQDYPD